MDPDTMTRDGPPDTDCALIDAAVEAMVAENRARAMRLDAVSEFHARRVAEVGAGGREGPGYFLLTPLQSTKAELGPALAISELFIQGDLAMTDGLKLWFPRLWSQCLAGRLDISRARLAQAQLGNLTSADDKAVPGGSSSTSTGRTTRARGSIPSATPACSARRDGSA